jgi:hypothetical protein
MQNDDADGWFYSLSLLRPIFEWPFSIVMCLVRSSARLNLMRSTSLNRTL